MKTQSLYLSIVSGVVGITLGATSVLAVQAGIIRVKMLHGAPISHGIRAIQEQGEENRKTGKRADVVYPTGTRP